MRGFEREEPLWATGDSGKDSSPPSGGVMPNSFPLQEGKPTL
ncbi:hypothetical protein [Helicobacter marmotae]|nr:hypothetical protein [Helicobacter marmotae]